MIEAHPPEAYPTFYPAGAPVLPFTFYGAQRPVRTRKKGSPFPDCLFEKRESRGERHAIRIRLLLGSSLFLSGFLFRCLLLGSCLEGLLFKRCLCCCKAGDRDAER